MKPAGRFFFSFALLLYNEDRHREAGALSEEAVPVP
jgi:hypothetical protein